MSLSVADLTASTTPQLPWTTIRSSCFVTVAHTYTAIVLRSCPYPRHIPIRLSCSTVYPRRNLFGWSPGRSGTMPTGNDNAPVSPDKHGEKKGDKQPEKKPEKSYLASAVESMNPWTTSRSSTPTPKSKDSTAPPQPKPAPPPARKADDHSTNTLYGYSLRKYPADCPPMNVMWFHAVDVRALSSSLL